MENEKKQEGAPKANNGERKPHHRRRRGYFIDPAQPKKDSAVPAVAEQKPAAPAPAQKNAQGQEQKQNTGDAPAKRKRHKKRRGNSQRPQNDAAATPEVRNEAAAKTPAPSANDGKNQKSDKSAQRNGDRSSRQNGGQKPPSQDRLIRPKDAKPSFDPSMYEEYEEVRFPAGEETASEVAAPTEEASSPMVEVVGIRFKSSGKVYYFAPNGKTVKRGDAAIVETARGQEFGEVAMGNTMVKESDTVPPLRPILRVATEADRVHHAENKKKEEDSFRICNEKIAAHGLDMKLIDAQYTFDNSKLLFYFTSAGRVDFRDLVKDLASVFRTRIELRQIGIRDEAKLMGGMGMCGRPLCCTLFLSDFGQVSIKMAKEQNLSLNSAKISGICGRLMCCLRYEHEAYEYEIKRTPPVDSLVKTADGTGSVTEINPLVGTIKVRLHASPDTPPKTYHREDVIMLRKKGDRNDRSDKNDKNEKKEK